MPFGNFGDIDLYKTVANDKGKPQRRKAVSLSKRALKPVFFHFPAGEIVWLPKAIGKSPDFKLSARPIADV